MLKKTIKIVKIRLVIKWMMNFLQILESSTLKNILLVYLIQHQLSLKNILLVCLVQTSRMNLTMRGVVRFNFRK